jgi:type IV secretion system protein TrbL
MRPLAQAGADCGVFDLECKSTQLVHNAFDEVVVRVTQGAADLVVAATSWWAQTDSVNPLDPAVLAAQGELRYLVLVILTISVVVQAGRLILSRKAEPLITVTTGLLRFVVVSALGLVVLQAGLRAGDQLSRDILDDAANNFAVLMVDNLRTQEGMKNNFVLLLVGLVAAVLSLLQWVLMLVRQAGLLVLAAMLPLAASGSLTRTTRGWLTRLLPWLIAIAVYKPAAAFVYFIGFTYLSTRSSNQPGEVSTLLAGLVVLLLALVAMPALMKFFSWSGTQVGGQSIGGSGLVSAAGAIAMSSRSPGQRASAQEATGPGSAGAGPRGAGPAAGATGSVAPAAVAVGSAAVKKARDTATGGTGEEPGAKQ